MRWSESLNERHRAQAGRPYPRVSSSEYSRIVQRFQEIVSTTVPRDAIVLVPSRGDEALLELGQRRGWHFPQDPSGKYAGHYPEDGSAVVAHVQDLTAAGAGYLAFPHTSLWWLDYYGELRQYLERQGKVLTEQDECIVFELPQGDTTARLGAAGDRCRRATARRRPLSIRWRRWSACLLPAGARIGILGPEGEDVLPLERQGYELLAIAARDPEASMRELRAAETRGARFVVLTSPTAGWLDSLPQLRAHLRREYEFVTLQRELCEIYERVPDARRGRMTPKRSRLSPDQARRPAPGRSLWQRLRSLLTGRNGA